MMVFSTVELAFRQIDKVALTDAAALVSDQAVFAQRYGAHREPCQGTQAARRRSGNSLPTLTVNGEAVIAPEV